jgi:ribosomal protein L11 methyltransferase
VTWIAVELKVGADVAESLADALFEVGAISVDVADAAAGTEDEQPIFLEPGADALPAWGSNRLTALFAGDVDAEAVIAEASLLAGLERAPAVRCYAVEEQDWVRVTQAQFEPIRIAGKLWIVPSWHAAPDPAAINIVLDPGLAFGTGSHPTTRLCLDWLAAQLKPGARMIDYGCGSGILAIAAAKLGAVEVIGVDIDPQALESSRYNARQNRVAATFVAANAPAPAPADVVVANILSGPLRVLAPLLAGLARPGGSIVLSGILASQARELADVYGAWFDMRPAVELEGWVRLEGVRHRR